MQFSALLTMLFAATAFAGPIARAEAENMKLAIREAEPVLDTRAQKCINIACSAVDQCPKRCSKGCYIPVGQEIGNCEN